MSITPILMPEIFQAIEQIIQENEEAVTALDQEIGDGDHVYNLLRGVEALRKVESDLTELAWPEVWKKVGMTVMSKVGGASGSLYGTIFIAMSKSAQNKANDKHGFAQSFRDGVEAMKKRGKSDVGEKTMLDVWSPVADLLLELTTGDVELEALLQQVNDTAEKGVEATRDMVATKGRAAFIGERTRGHLDAGAKTAQLMIAATSAVLLKNTG